jgi:hypothetical protein
MNFFDTVSDSNIAYRLPLRLLDSTKAVRDAVARA